MTFVHLSCQSQEGMEKVMNIEKYSKYSTLLRVTAYVRRIISNCRQSSTKITGELTSTEIEVAEQRWLLACQGSSFVEEITSLKSKTPKRHPLVRQLRLFVDDTGIIRCGGRIHNASVADVTRFPYILPRQHKLTNLIVQDAHENQLPAGTNATATQYWIPAIRQCVRSVLRKYVSCKRVQGKSCKPVESPLLQKYRIEESPPFSVTGVDLTGALNVRDRTGCQTKVYICLFTCASTRAVHLEIVQDLSQDSFMQAFRRFASRRSLSKIVGASHQLRRLFESAAVKELLSRKGTEWHFIPKRAPWYGGWWERLIGLTKSALKKVLGRSLFNMETLHTQNEVLNQFWKRWRTEYLTALRESHKLTGTTLQSIAVGDVVQIHDECPRSQWKLGIVQELITGRDGLTRAAHVRTTRGVTTRPIVKLYPLEVTSDNEH
ncbi:uncharacterized protein LOC127861714 [Dreissena polymorpha]|uniref:uncharacterized protein LOC127861714 n=1 Tax=Dreissena polymorpha TaxID=45954 RepID=UPI0022646FA3|nr:uncharacterized protein LOC127861714 [Dreissena polymorpha]